MRDTVDVLRTGLRDLAAVAGEVVPAELDDRITSRVGEHRRRRRSRGIVITSLAAVVLVVAGAVLIDVTRDTSSPLPADEPTGFHHLRDVVFLAPDGLHAVNVRTGETRQLRTAPEVGGVAIRALAIAATDQALFFVTTDPLDPHVFRMATGSDELVEVAGAQQVVTAGPGGPVWSLRDGGRRVQELSASGVIVGPSVQVPDGAQVVGAAEDDVLLDAASVFMRWSPVTGELGTIDGVERRWVIAAGRLVDQPQRGDCVERPAAPGWPASCPLRVAEIGGAVLGRIDAPPNHVFRQVLLDPTGRRVVFSTSVFRPDGTLEGRSGAFVADVDDAGVRPTPLTEVDWMTWDVTGRVLATQESTVSPPVPGTSAPAAVFLLYDVDTGASMRVVGRGQFVAVR